MNLRIMSNSFVDIDYGGRNVSNQGLKEAKASCPHGQSVQRVSYGRGNSEGLGLEQLKRPRNILGNIMYGWKKLGKDHFPVIYLNPCGILKKINGLKKTHVKCKQYKIK